MTKDSLRQQALQNLLHFPKKEKAEADRRLISRLLASPAYQEARVVATYLNLPNEVETSDIMATALSDGKVVLVPKVMSRTEMVFVPYDPDQLEVAAFGILQPISHQAMPKEAIDLIHVPGVAFNASGYRIGYGGGYYDRYLADYQGMTIATAYACQLTDFQPDSHDIPVKELFIDDPTQTNL